MCCYCPQTAAELRIEDIITYLHTDMNHPWEKEGKNKNKEGKLAFQQVGHLGSCQSAVPRLLRLLLL
jgi:hypothetical protein